MPVIPLGEFALSRVTPRADNTRVDMSPTNVAGRGAAALGEALSNTSQQLGQMAVQAKAKETQEAENLARAKAANASLDRERQVNALKLETADKLDAGEIEPEKVDSYFSEQLTKIKTPELPDLEPHVRETFNGGIGRTDAEAKDSIAHLVRVGKRKALTDQFPAGLQIIEQSAQQPGADFERLIKQADQLRAAGTLGAWSESDIDAKIMATKNVIGVTAAQALVMRDPEAARTIFAKRLAMPAENSQTAQLRSAFEIFDAQQASGNPKAQENLDAAITKAGGVPEDFSVTVGEAGDTSPAALSALTVQQTAQYYHAADAAIRQKEAEARQADDAGRVTFRQNMQDTETALRNGESVPIPDIATAAHYLGEEAGAIAVKQMTVLQSMAGALATLKTASPAETNALLEQYKPSGTDNRQVRQQAFEQIAQQAAQVAAARKADPGQYVLDNAPVVANAFKRYAALTIKANMDPGASADQMQANRDYLNLSINEQRRMGVAQPKLPKLYVEGVALDFKSNVTKFPQATVARLEQTGKMLQDTPMALDQLSAAVGPAGVFALEGVGATTVQKLADVATVSETDRKKLLPANVKWADLETSVAKAMAPLTRTFLAQNAGGTATRYNEAAMKLAYARIVENGESRDQAAADAYQELVGERYHPMTETYRVPKDKPLEAVQTGLDVFMRGYDPSGLRLAPESGFSPEETAFRKWRTLSNSGHWVNNDTDTGVYLYGRDGSPALTKDGKPLFVKFDSVLKLKPERIEIDRTLRHH